MRVSRCWWSACAGLLVVAVGCTKNEGSGRSNTGREAPAPDPRIKVTICDFDGVEAAIAAAKGKVVLIDCWATWCPPCVASFPHLVEKQQKYADKGLAAISVSLDDVDDLEDVNRFLREHEATFTNLLLRKSQANGKALREKLAYDGGIPHAVLLDRTGQRVWAGHPEDDSLQGRLEAELAKK
jgi:thiol-disulfide isomerase/thioredoxin